MKTGSILNKDEFPGNAEQSQQDALVKWKAMEKTAKDNYRSPRSVYFSFMITLLELVQDVHEVGVLFLWFKYAMKIGQDF